MATVKYPILIWRDEQKNYYGKLLFSPVSNIQSQTCGSSKKNLIQNLKKIVEKVLKTKDVYDNDSECDYKFKTLSFKVKTKAKIAGKLWQVPDEYVINTSYVYVINENYGSANVIFPFEDIDESFLLEDENTSQRKNISPHQIVKIYAERTAKEYYKRHYYESIIKMHTRLDEEIEMISCKIPRISKEDTSFSMNQDMRLLYRLAVPFSRTMIKEFDNNAFQREKEIESLLDHLRQSDNGIILCGKSGCGKTSILLSAIRVLEKEYREQAKMEDNSSLYFAENCFWQTNAQRMKIGTVYLGEWQEQFQFLLEKVASFRGVLCFEKIVDLIDNPANPENSMASFLIPYLEKQQVKMIGEATPEELMAMRRLIPDFTEKFSILNISEMEKKDAVSVLDSYIANFKNTQKTMQIDSDISHRTVDLCHRFYKERVLPGSAISFLKKYFKIWLKKKKSEFTSLDLWECMIRETGLPDWVFRADLGLKYEDVLKTLENAVIGQPVVCQSVTRSIINFKAGLNNPQKPIATLLFCGPTGVGKTQMAKSLAEYLFNNKNIEDREAISKNAVEHLYRLDMSEFQFPFSASRLIEKPDDSPSALIEHIRKNPFSVVLFDEIEKADSSIYDILLSLLDEGRLTDRLGRTTYFRDSIIIMTSNLGGSLKDPLGFTSSFSDSDPVHHFSMKNQEYREQAYEAVERYFRPEFINRIDEILFYNSLDKKSCEKIIALELKALEKLEGLALRKIHLAWSLDLVKYLLKIGFDSKLGARPLQRAIENEIVRHLGIYLTKYPDKNGTTLMIDRKDRICITDQNNEDRSEIE